MNKLLSIVFGLLLLAVLLLFSMTYTVSFHEVAIKTTFGRTGEDSVVTDPGLKFKLPIFADKITKYDTRLQLLETPEMQIQTADDLQLVVRAYMLWKINTETDQGPLQFFNNYSTIADAGESLEDLFRSEVKNSTSRFSFDDLLGVDSKLSEAEENIRIAMLPVQDKGVLPVTIGISRVLLPAKTTTAVMGRMSETRRGLSEAERTRGNAEAVSIESDAKAKKEKILAFANLRAADIRRAGNAQAARYLEMMGEEPDLAIFLTWLDALELSLSQNTTVVLPTTVEPFHLMDLDAPLDMGFIPQPDEDLNKLQHDPANQSQEEES